MFYCHSFPVIDANQAESTSCERDNTSLLTSAISGCGCCLYDHNFTNNHSGSDSSAEKSQWKSLCKNKAWSYTLTLVWHNNYVIGFDTELRLELQINQWSSLRSQRQHMRKSPNTKHCELISIYTTDGLTPEIQTRSRPPAMMPTM